MAKITFSSEYFSVKDTLECGQTFRFYPFGAGYLVFSKDKCAYAYNDDCLAVIECADGDEEYFYNYFDLDRDYGKVVNSALSFNIPALSLSATLGKGIRILNQDSEEMLFSFIFSQNNNIPRIKASIEKLCVLCGDKRTFGEIEYYAFPTASKIATLSDEQLKSTGIGYRTGYVSALSKSIVDGFSAYALNALPTEALREKLIGIHGVGAKVANCVTLFGYHRSDSFPVDTWIEKVYRENFNGTLTDRNKITEFFLKEFGENAGYFQQYLFYYKRSLEKAEKGAKK